MHTRSWRIASYVNDINPVNWKIVLVGYMQLGFVLIVMGVWAVYVLRNPEKGLQIDVLWVVAGLLAGLSGINVAGRGIDRTTDYGYVERKNAGKVAVAQQQASMPSQVNVTGDGASVTATQPAAALPTPAPLPAATVVPVAPRKYDPGA